MSKVFKFDAHLHQDQLFRICEYLKIDHKLADYLSLSLEYQRSDYKSRKQALLHNLERIQSEHLETKEHLAAADASTAIASLQSYYLDPWNQLIHLALLIPRYAQEPVKLIRDLNISELQLAKSLRILEQEGIIVKESGKYKVGLTHLHLPREHPLFHSWRMLTRMMSLQLISSSGADDRHYSYSVAFTATEATFNKLKKGFFEYLAKCEKEVTSASDQHLYQLNFDLLKWL